MGDLRRFPDHPKRPELDDELTIALERLEQAEAGVRFYAGELKRARMVRDAVRNVSPHTRELNEVEVVGLEEELSVAQADAARWKENLEDLQKRAAHPRKRKDT